MTWPWWTALWTVCRFYAVLKLNYRPGFTHVTNVMGNGQCSTIAPQRTLLPGNSKADEAALIDRATWPFA